MFGLAVAAGPGAGPALPAAIAALVPLAGLLGSLALPESPLHRERRAEQKLAVLRGESGGGWRDQVQQFPFTALKVLQVFLQVRAQCNIPLRSPAVHQPLLLILAAILLQHLSGTTFTKKFLLQVLDPHTNQVVTI